MKDTKDGTVLFKPYIPILGQQACLLRLGEGTGSAGSRWLPQMDGPVLEVLHEKLYFDYRPGADWSPRHPER